MDALEFLREGIKLYEQKQYGKAIVAFTRALENESEYPEAYYNRGLAKLDLGLYEKAISDFESAADILSREPYSNAYWNAREPYKNVRELYYYRGVARKAIGDIAGAIEDWRKALTGGMTLATLRLAEIADARGNQEAALKLYYRVGYSKELPKTPESERARRRATELWENLYKRPTQVPLIQYYDFSAAARGWVPIGIGIGVNQELFLLCASKIPDYRHNRFANYETILGEYLDYRLVVISADQQRITEILISSENWDYSFVQLLPAEEVLLVTARCYRYKDGTFDRNGRIFGYDGKLCRALLLGDAIEDVQVDSDGNIWAAFSEEGTWLGNYGWGYDKNLKKPVGSDGAIVIRHGKETFERIRLSLVCCNESLNIGPFGDVHCVYHTVGVGSLLDGHFVAELSGPRRDMIRCPVPSVLNFAKNRCSFLFAHKMRSEYAELEKGLPSMRVSLCNLKQSEGGEKSWEIVSQHVLVDEEGLPLEPVAGRGPYLWLSNDKLRVYRIHIDELAQ